MRRGVDYFGAWNGRLYALDLRTHAAALDALARREDHVERRDRRRHASSSATTAAALWALSPRHGRDALGRARVNGRVYGTPAVAARPRVRAVVDRRLADGVLDAAAAYLWRVGTGAYVYSSPAAWGGRVFFGSYNGVFYGVSAASGRMLWGVGTGGPISGRGRRRRRRRLRGQLLAPHRRRRRAQRPCACSASGTGITCRCPETGCAYFFTATLVSMQWSPTIDRETCRDASIAMHRTRHLRHTRK